MEREGSKAASCLGDAWGEEALQGEGCLAGVGYGWMCPVYCSASSGFVFIGFCAVVRSLCVNATKQRTNLFFKLGERLVLYGVATAVTCN